MIFSSGILRPSPIYLKDGQAIVVTTDDEGVFLSMDYGQSWASLIDADYAVIPSAGSVAGHPYLFATFYEAGFLTVRKYDLATGTYTDYNTSFGGSLNDLKSFSDLLFLLAGIKIVERNVDGVLTNLESYTTHTYTDNVVSMERHIGGLGIGNAYLAVLTRAGAFAHAYIYGANYGNYDTDFEVDYSLDYPSKMIPLSDTEVSIFGAGVFHKVNINTHAIVGQYNHPFTIDQNYVPVVTDYLVANGAGLLLGNINGTVALSTDNGQNWTVLLSGADARGVAMSKTGQVQVIARYNNYLKISTDYGQTFNNNVTLGVKNITGVSMYRRVGKLIFQQA